MNQVNWLLAKFYRKIWKSSMIWTKSWRIVRLVEEMQMVCRPTRARNQIVKRPTSPTGRRACKKWMGHIWRRCRMSTPRSTTGKTATKCSNSWSRNPKLQAEATTTKIAWRSRQKRINWRKSRPWRVPSLRRKSRGLSARLRWWICWTMLTRASTARRMEMKRRTSLLKPRVCK